MGKDRNEGVVDAAQNTVRQTTGALRGEGPWHSAGSEVYTTTPTARPATAWTPRMCGRGRAASRFAASASG